MSTVVLLIERVQPTHRVSVPLQLRPQAHEGSLIHQKQAINTKPSRRPIARSYQLQAMQRTHQTKVWRLDIE